MPSVTAFFLSLVFASVSFVGGYTMFDRSKHVLAEVV
jgi:hypothetical protein